MGRPMEQQRECFAADVVAKGGRERDERPPRLLCYLFGIDPHERQHGVSAAQSASAVS
jgi:hypothetical protein